MKYDDVNDKIEKTTDPSLDAKRKDKRAKRSKIYRNIFSVIILASIITGVVFTILNA